MKIRYCDMVAVTKYHGKIIYYDTNNREFYISKKDFREEQVKIEKLGYTVGMGFLLIIILRILQGIIHRPSLLLLMIGFGAIYFLALRLVRPVRHRLEEVENYNESSYVDKARLKEELKNSFLVFVFLVIFFLATLLLVILYFQTGIHVIGILGVSSALPLFILWLLGTFKRLFVMLYLYGHTK